MFVLSPLKCAFRALMLVSQLVHTIQVAIIRLNPAARKSHSFDDRIATTTAVKISGVMRSPPYASISSVKTVDKLSIPSHSIAVAPSCLNLCLKMGV